MPCWARSGTSSARWRNAGTRSPLAPAVSLLVGVALLAGLGWLVRSRLGVRMWTPRQWRRTAAVAVAAAFLLPRKPVGMYHNEGEETFWRSVRRDPHFTMDDIRSRYRYLDGRLQVIEHYVTSPRFDLDQKFRDLE